MGERSGVGCLNLACKKWRSCINLKSDRSPLNYVAAVLPMSFSDFENGGTE